MNDDQSTRGYDILIGILVILAILVACLTLILIVQQFRGDDGGGFLPGSPDGESDPIWDRVESEGTLRVGMAADYPPFAFYNTSFQLDGLDVAIMQEVGRRLGINIEYTDMVFDGLLDAVQIGQVDAAIGGISVTAERQAIVSFSNVYLVSNDAIIAQSDSTIPTITNIDQIATYRVGVEQGTVFESWIQDVLIDTGKMPAGNLLLYQKVDQAVDDLRAGRNDLVVGDLPAAQVAVGVGGVKIVGQGLHPQSFAFALPLEAPALQSNINAQLAAMQADGTLNRLIQQYLNLPPDQIVPIPTANPSVTPVPTASPPTCTNGMAFIEDLNYDDQNMTNPPVLQAGQPFRKGWRIRNSGTCTWDSSYALHYLTGNTPAAQMGGQTTPIVGTVAPNQVYDMYVDLVAPITPGTYQGFWGMENGAGQAFGDRIWVGISVPPAPTGTPQPTLTPSPSMNFTVDRNQITAGECVTFNWTVTGGAATYFYQQGLPWQQHPVAPQGSSQECPPQTTTYELRAVYPDTTTEVRPITVFVDPAPGAPVIETFAIDPPYQIETGQCVAVSWVVTGSVTNVRILRNNSALWDPAPVSATWQDCPPGPGTVTYTIEATGQGGTSRLQRNLSVVDAPPQATATSPPVEAPVIYNFSAVPEAIQVGGCISLSWAAGGGATSTRLLRDGVVVLDNGGLNGQAQDCLGQPGVVTYRLEARSASDSVFQDRAVTVQGAEPTNPLAGSVWDLQSYNNGTGGVVTVIADTSLTAEFSADGTRISGSAGCNTYRGTYTVQGPSIAIRNVTSTQTTCATPDGIMQQESQYLALLQTAVTYQRNGSELVLQDATGATLLTYQEVVAQPR